MNVQLKKLTESIGHTRTRNIVQSHVKELDLKDKHLVIYLDNAGPLHELNSKDHDPHLQRGLEKVYDTTITYELKLKKPGRGSEREKSIPHAIKR